MSKKSRWPFCVLDGLMVSEMDGWMIGCNVISVLRIAMVDGWMGGCNICFKDFL